MTRRVAKACEAPDQDELLRSVIEECGDLQRILELVYWSREPELLSILRAVAALPQDARALVDAFLTLAQEPESIRATLDGTGRLVLASAKVQETVATFQMALSVVPGEPRTLN